MSRCTDVKGHLPKKTDDKGYFKLLVLLTEWHLECLKTINGNNRDGFPGDQEKILFDAITAEVDLLKPDLIQINMKNLKFITTGLGDYEFGEHVDFKTFLVESLISCYISIVEEVPKVTTKDKYLRDKLNVWVSSITDIKGDKGIKLDLDSSTRAKIDRYLTTRRDADSLYEIYSVITSPTEIFQTNKISIQEKILTLQRIFHTTGECLKDTRNTPSLSSDVRQSLEKVGIPVKRLCDYRDMLTHYQVFSLIQGDDKVENVQVKKLFDSFLVIKELIGNKIIEIEESLIREIIKGSKIDANDLQDLLKLIDDGGVQGLKKSIEEKQTDNVWSRQKKDMNKEGIQSQVLDYVYQNIRKLKSAVSPKSLATVTKRKLTKNELKSLYSIRIHISQSKSQIYKKLLVELKSWRFDTYTGNLKKLHDDALKVTEVIDLLRNKDISSSNNRVLDEFLGRRILTKITAKNSEQNTRSSTEKVEERSLKQELELYFDGESFKNNDLYYAPFGKSNPENLIESLINSVTKPDDNKLKLIKFFKSKQSHNESPDNDISPEEYERLVTDLPTNWATKQKLFLYSVEWRRKKCVELLEKNMPALKTIYDNIMQGNLMYVSVYKELALQYELPPESEMALTARAESLNKNLEELYLKRTREEHVVMKKLTTRYATESQYINLQFLAETAYKAKKANKGFNANIRIEQNLKNSKKLRNKLSHIEPLVSSKKKMPIKLVEGKNTVMEKVNDAEITLDNITADLKAINDHSSPKDTGKKICLRGQRGRTRRYASEGCLTWEEIEQLSEEGAENGDLDNIRIDSGKFISRISIEDLEANEEKLTNLIALASESEVIGHRISEVDMLTDCHRYLGHLGRVGKVSGMVMHGMIAKDLVGDLLRGDYEDLTKTVGIFIIGTGLQTVAEVTSLKGAEYILKGRAVLGNTLRFASPFLSRGVTAFIAWDLYKQVKEYEKGNKDALVSIIGDSVQVGVDSIELGIETAEVSGLLEGVSAVTGPIGLAVGALVFIGTDVFTTVRTVQRIDELIHLTVWQELTEGLRAFLGQRPSDDIENKIEVKDANNQAVKYVTCLLKDNPHIRRYVLPSVEVYTVEEPNPAYDSWITIVDDPVSYGAYPPSRKVSVKYTRTVLDNVVLLDEKKYDIKWSRTGPDNVSGFDLFCLPKGDLESVRKGGTYYCDSAIGVEYTDNVSTGNDTWISLGDGNDVIKGFPDSSNIFYFGEGHKEMTGGNKNDTFIFGGKSVNATWDSENNGFIEGGGGIDTIDVDSLAPHYNYSKGLGSYQVFADFRKGILKDTSKVALNIHNINVYLGRKGGVDQVVAACDTKHVDGRGGENKHYSDSIVIPEDDACSYDTKVTVNPDTKVTNNATSGNFLYIVKGEKGKEAYVELGPSSQSHNTFAFNYTLKDVAAIDKSKKNITFSFVEEFYTSEKKIDVNSSFNLTISGADKNTITYQLIDRTKIVIGRNNVYALQNVEMPIICLVKDYSSIADKLQMYIVVHSDNDVLVAGHNHGDVLMNDPNATASHLVGGGGENVFVISSGQEKLTFANLPMSGVVIYNFHQDGKIDTLDLREIKEQLKKDMDRDIKAEVSEYCCDLLIRLYLDDASNKEVVTITLRGALKNDWYKRVHVVIDNTFVIKEILGDFQLTPQPLIFDDSKSIYVIDQTIMGKGDKVRVKKYIGQYIFARANDSLVITNPLSSNVLNVDRNNFFTIILNDFYYENNRDKMQHLKIEFDDRRILLRAEIEGINSAVNFSELMRKVKIDSYKATINGIKKRKLFEAIGKNNIDEFKDLIERGVSVDTVNNDSQTPLQIAALHGKLEVVKYLVEEKHAAVNIQDNYGNTILPYAAYSSSLNVVKYVVEEIHADVNVGNYYDITPLHYAALAGNLEVVKYLVEEKHADVNVKTSYLNTILHYAALGGNVEVVKYLVEEKHAYVNENNYLRITPLHYAASMCSLNVVKYLVDEKGANINVRDNAGEFTPLFYAIGVKREVVTKRVEDINLKRPLGWLPLPHADCDNILEIIKYIVEEKHADINEKNKYEVTLLHYAALHSNLNVVKYLVEEKHAEVNVKDDFDTTPLDSAIRSGNLELVKYLIDQKHADLDAKNDVRITPLHNAAIGSNLEVLKYLVEEKHADVNVKNYVGLTPLHYAVSSGSISSVKYLVGEKHADVNAKDHEGKTPLDSAAFRSDLELVKYLVEKGADVNLKNHDGLTVLYTASSKGNVEIVNYLIGNGADVNVKSNMGLTPLHIAASHSDTDMVNYLIEKGARIDIKFKGKTPLYFQDSGKYGYVIRSIIAKLTERLFDAVKYNDLEEVQDLLNQGVSVYVQRDDGQTLLNYADGNVKLKLLKYLSEIKGVDSNVQTRFNRQTSLDLDVAGNYSNIVEHLDRKLNIIRETPRQHERSHHHSSRGLLTTDSSNQPEIGTSNASEKSSWINDLVGSIVKSQESSAPSETSSSNHPIRHERRKIHNDHSRHEDGMRMRMRRVRHRHRRVQKRNVKYQDSHYYIDQPEIAASSGTRPSSWINGLVDWMKEKGGGLLSSVADKFAAKESGDSKSRGIHACSVRLEKMYRATIPNIPRSRESQDVPKGNIPNTSWSGWSSNREKVTSNVTDTPEMNITVLNYALMLGDLAVRLVNGTRHKQPIHENLLSPREKSMRFIDENMIMRTIQQGKEKFGGLATNMDEEQVWNWEISG